MPWVRPPCMDPSVSSVRCVVFPAEALSHRLNESGSGFQPLSRHGSAARCRCHVELAFIEGGSGVLPLDVIQPDPRRLCHASAG